MKDYLKNNDDTKNGEKLKKQGRPQNRALFSLFEGL